ADFQYEFAKELNPDISLEYSNFEPMENNKFQASFPMPNPYNANFITIGRLSPEKDHMKLIKSFFDLSKTHPDTRLYIVGEGALKTQLEQLVDRLNLNNRVIFTGQLNNPYPLLSMCDCFVLSSNYEGQAIVLLEALILEKPIITTDVPGPRSVVEGGYGLIVENTTEGLTDGMQQFLNDDRLNDKQFDYKGYQQNALSMFYSKVCELHE